MGAPAFRVRFARDDGFHSELRREVDAYFERTGRPARGGRAMHVKTAVILGWFTASYALLLTLGGASAWLALGLTISLALATAGIGFSVMHDANHGAYSCSPRVNRTVGLALDFIGASSYVWRFKHNVLAWYLGGLNFQIEHHLFPGVCHVHYPALAASVKETCRAHGIPYRVQPTLWAALAAHHRHLRALGASARG